MSVGSAHHPAQQISARMVVCQLLAWSAWLLGTESPALTPARCQMRVSTLSGRSFGLILLLIAGTAGCGQSGPGVRASLTAPSSLESGATHLGPGASYDASGLWRVTVTQRNLTNNQVQTFEFDSVITQDADGNLQSSDGVTMTRLASGSRIAYTRSQLSSLIRAATPNCQGARRSIPPRTRSRRI